LSGRITPVACHGPCWRGSLLPAESPAKARSWLFASDLNIKIRIRIPFRSVARRVKNNRRGMMHAWATRCCHPIAWRPPDRPAGVDMPPRSDETRVPPRQTREGSASAVRRGARTRRLRGRRSASKYLRRLPASPGLGAQVMSRGFVGARAFGSARPNEDRSRQNFLRGENAQLSELKDADRGRMTPHVAPGCRSMELINQNLQDVRSRSPREDLTCPSGTYMGVEQ
jgi:hypothetical protein